ncbi:MAG: VWA domain-containing protein [Cyclobacteriaceae bacterium]|nr:VWA domain-containing protein [Cyclobacteriaceae bacterium]
MRYVILLLVISSQTSFAQPITAAQQKALNNYVDYINHTSDDLTAVAKSIINYYPTLQQKKSFMAPRYVCPIQTTDYHFNKALQESAVLGNTLSTSLLAKVKELHLAVEKVETTCKALDTYHKLEDYKQDDFAKARLLISDLQVMLMDTRKRQGILSDELRSAYRKMNAYMENNPYHKADGMMRQQIERERSLLEAWTFNLNEDVHTGWPVDVLEKSILETDNQLRAFNHYTPALKYPASSMYSSFKGSLGDILESKRSGLDGYNFEAKKSDRHSNAVYLGLINYFNGTLVADYNTFIQFAERDTYFGLKAIQYFPAFEVRSQVKSTEIEIKPFADIPRVPVASIVRKSPISKPVAQALNGYVDYMNECWRQVRYMQMVLRSFNSSARYYKGLTSFQGRGGLHYDYKDFQLPLSLYQKLKVDSNVIDAVLAKSLNAQAEVLMNILKEMDQLSAALEVEVKEKRYEKDGLKKVYEILERNHFLFDQIDTKKGQLYQDVRLIFDAYPAGNVASSWSVSGKALQGLVDLDRTGLFGAKAYYKGDASTTISTEAIDKTLREVIANEFDNMKGIQKLGRYNGLCPYTPYEDLPQSSKSLSELLSKLKPVKASVTRHPYQDMVYHYNDIVEDYNKFCELSKEVWLLKTVKQPELFFVLYPEDRQTSEPEILHDGPAVLMVTEGEKKKENPVVVITDKTKVIHDTVYIEKRDTVYLTGPGEEFRSMEGYATNNMVLLLDVSGSMNAPEKLPLLKQSVFNMLSMMRQEDQVSIIIYSGKAKVLLPPTSFKEEARIKEVINGLKPGGKTDGNAGIKLAYKTADANYVRGGNNRIILATDGEFPVTEQTLKLIEKSASEDIFLSVFNFGKGNSSMKNLEKLSSTGLGNYAYISRENAERNLIQEAKAKKKK